MTSTAAGLGALGFWLFVAAVVVAGIWYDLRRREAQQETLRRIVESGRDIDKQVIDQILDTGGSRDIARDLRIASLIVLAASPGLAILGVFLGRISAEALSALLGVALLVASVGIGLWLAARMVERRYSDHSG